MTENAPAVPPELDSSQDDDKLFMRETARRVPNLLKGKKRKVIATGSAVVIGLGIASGVKQETSTGTPISPEKRVKIWDGAAFFKQGTPLEDEHGHTVMEVPEDKVLELQDFHVGYDYQTESRYAQVTIGGQRLRINVNNAEANGLIASAYVRKQDGRKELFHAKVTVDSEGRVMNPSGGITEINQGSFINPQQIEQIVEEGGLVKPHGPPSPF